MKVDGEYLDNGPSGLTLNRPAFTRLNANARAGSISVMFVKSISRIGRDTRISCRIGFL